MLDQQIVGATSLNTFKNGLDTIRKTRRRADCSAKPCLGLSGWLSCILLVTGEAIQGELQCE